MIGCPREHSVLEGYGFSRAALTSVFEGRVGHGAFAARLKPCPSSIEFSRRVPIEGLYFSLFRHH
jgi:hypothetical protein